MIKAILACDDTGGVSKKGTMPWPHNSTDLRWFKENTAGHVVIMGSTTWADPGLPKPLPKRVNVLATSQPKLYTGVDRYISGNLNFAINRLEQQYPGLIIWIIGGPNIIEQTLNSIDEFYLSRIPGDFECDTHLPLKQIESLFDLHWQEEHEAATFQIWKKRKTVS
jgi:dihydrofolate reductase